jgi:DNA-binding CsgD family transcriptional regulator
VFRQLLLGKKAPEIAKMLKLSPSSVYRARANIGEIINEIAEKRMHEEQ